MNDARRLSTVILLAGACLAAPAPPAAADSIGKALKRGTWEVDLRYRFERADVDGFAQKGDASTLRTAVLYRSAWYNDFRLGVTFENVSDLGFDKQHDDGSNGIARPLVPDAELTDLDEAWLAWRGLGETTLAVGRMRLALGNERFVGPVGWRQSHQTFDGVSLRTSAIPRTTATLTRLRNVRRVNGSNLGLEGNLLYAEVDLDRAGTFAPYWFDLDFDPASFAAQSTTTVGGAWSGRWGCCREYTIPFRVEYASQSETGDNPADLDVDYTRVELGAERDAWSLDAIWESLGADAGGTFTTPLATLHAFNGWADVFVGGLPAGGLEDRALRAGWAKDDWSVTLIRHDFRAETGSAKYGTELDAQIVWSADWGQKIGFTMASYDADQLGVDVSKLWLWTTYGF